MSEEHEGQQWTTASVEAVPKVEGTVDPTPGLVLVYSRLHAHLPSALPFASDTVTVGREADNTLCIPEAAVSRYHAKVGKRPDGFWVVDNGSTNGTIVNGERVDAARLEDFDVVRIGDTLFRYAAHGIYGYGAYRVDGTVVRAARPVEHHIEEPFLRGGYQMDSLLARIEKVAPSGLAVVITGESGTGKELVARELHRASRREGAFQAINCAALPPNLIESELFGYRKGAFTGASTDKQGLVKAADGGTLFLDEIGDMPLEAQAKLLRVVQEKEVLPVGATQAEPVDVRVVCATHRNMDAFVDEGRFRGDLLARLRECAFELPPLRHRLEDLYPLVRYFLRKAGRSEAQVTFSYMLALTHYDWPYNVRELESAVKLSLTLAEDSSLDLVHLPDGLQKSLEGHGQRARASAGPAESGMPPATGSATAPTPEQLRELLTRHRGNIAAVGRELGKERMQVHRWLKRYRIDANDFRG
ncbi:MAG: sigma 54-interacting transcriptional regulator [Polyangiales bacterium]